MGVLRHILTLVGGILVALGFISDVIFAEGIDVIMTAVGAVMSLWGFISSFLAPEKKITEGQYQALKSAA